MTMTTRTQYQYNCRVEQSVRPHKRWKGCVTAANLRSAEIVALSKAALELRANPRDLDVTHCNQNPSLVLTH